MPLAIPGLHVSQRIHSHILEQPLAAPRAGIMLHYDDSSRDDWAVAWFSDPHCTNGYSWLALDDGALVELADPALRTPHAGPCLTPNANSAYYGLSAATNGVVLATPKQLETMIATCVALFRFHQWSSATVATRIVGHDAQAIWTRSYTRSAGLSDADGAKRWGTLGRKVDPTGTRKDKTPIVDIGAVRVAVARQLDPMAHA